MRKPDFFIIGGPKCGTTALNDYLAGHAGIFMPDEKEINVFCSDLDPGMRTYDNLTDYEKIFTGAAKDQMIGEASVWYLYSQAALRNILEYNPQAKFIAMVRNPLEMAYSLHNQNVLNMKEDIEDFSAAWEAQEERRAGTNIPPYCLDAQTLDYLAVCSLGAQVERFFAEVPEEQRLLILYDDFKADTGASYRSTLAFLGLEDDGRQNFQSINVSSKARSKVLQRILRDPPPPLSWVWPWAKAVVNALGFRPAVALEKMNRKAHRRAPLSAAFKQKMSAAYRDDIAKLSKIIARDLSHWLEKG